MHRLVSRAHMQSLGIGVRIDRNGADAHGTRSADDPAGDFAPVGDEEGLDHRQKPDNITILWLGGIMFKLYCLPGKFFARLGYLFPGKNQLWASGRRRDSRLVHFLFATPFWLIVGLLAFGTIFGSFSMPSREATSETVLAEERANGSPNSVQAIIAEVDDTPNPLEVSEQNLKAETEPVETPEPEIVFVPGTGAEPTTDAGETEISNEKAKVDEGE